MIGRGTVVRRRSGRSARLRQSTNKCSSPLRRATDRDRKTCQRDVELNQVSVEVWQATHTNTSEAEIQQQEWARPPPA